MNYGLLLYLKLARVDVGNVSKKGKNMEGIFFLASSFFLGFLACMEGIIAWSIFASWFFYQTLSIYVWSGIHTTPNCNFEA